MTGKVPYSGIKPATKRKISPESTGDDMCITGISGFTGSCLNIMEFKEMLFNKDHAFKFADRKRFDPVKYDFHTPQALCTGWDTYDWEFFNTSVMLAEWMDPQMRKILEVVYEAITDAGVTMEDLKGTTTGVYVTAQVPEASDIYFDFELIQDKRNRVRATTGVVNCMKPGKVSHTLDLKGSAIFVDNACSSILTCMEIAAGQMRSGVVDRAIVCGANTMFLPKTSKMYMDMTITNVEGRCYSFDARANGYARNECCGAFLIQKRSEAKRIYSRIVHVTQGADGLDEDHDYGHPSTPGQTKVIGRLYEETGIDATQIDYVECHGTGTPAGDPTEVASVENVFGGKSRKNPITVGSVKSNLGHGENMAGWNSVCKMIFGFEEGVLIPNINYETPSPLIPGLLEGRVKVCTEVTPFDKNMVAINSFGMNGTTGHCLLQADDWSKDPKHPNSESLRLFTYAARTEEGLNGIFQEVQKYSKNVPYQALLECSANQSPIKLPFRGFTILNSETPDVKVETAVKRPLAYIFTGMGCQWNKMGKEMFQIDAFHQSVKTQCENGKKHYDDNLYEKLKAGIDLEKECSHTYIMGLTVIQIALVDVLTSLGIKPDYIIGHSMGEIAAGYADGCLTAEQCFAICHYRLLVTERPEIKGKMASVGLPKDELMKVLHPAVDMACHNSATNCTISGPSAAVDGMVAQLQAKEIFAKEVASSGKSYHSRYLNQFSQNLSDSIKAHVSSKKRSEKWISTSFPPSEWDSPDCTIAGVGYFVRNLIGAVNFYEACSELPKDCIAIELGAHGLLQSLVKGTTGPDSVVITAMRRNKDDNILRFYDMLGTMYLAGVNFKPLDLFPEKVQWPVPRGTPMTGHLIAKQWRHGEKFRVPEQADTNVDSSFNWTLFFEEGDPDMYLMDSVVNQRPILSTGAYFVLAWEALANRHMKRKIKLPVVFEDVSIPNLTYLTAGDKMVIECKLTDSGHFEIVHERNILASGRIRPAEEANNVVESMTSMDDVVRNNTNATNQKMSEDTDELYRHFFSWGYDYKGTFRAIKTSDLHESTVEWSEGWYTFVEACFQAHLLARDTDVLAVPNRIDRLYLDVSSIAEEISEYIVAVQKLKEEAEEEEGEAVEVDLDSIDKPEIPVWADYALKSVSSDVVRIQGISYTVLEKTIPQDPAVHHDKMYFVPFYEDLPEAFDKDLSTYADTCSQYAAAGMKKLLDDNAPFIPTGSKKILKDALKGLPSTNMKALQSSIDKYMAEPNTGLAQTLNSLFNSPISKATGVDDILTANMTALSEDRLLDSLNQPMIYDFYVQLLWDAIEPKNAVMEVRAERGRMFRTLTPRLACFTGINYLATYDKVQPEGAEEFECKPVVWTPSSDEAPPTIKAHLLILKNVLHEQADPLALLERLNSSVAPGGFILVQEVTQNFLIQAALEGLHQGLEVPTVNGPRDCGRFMTDSAWQTLLAKTGFPLVYRKSDGLLSTTYLLRKPVDVPPTPTFIKAGGIDCDWVDDVQEEYSKLLSMEEDEEDRSLWLIVEDPLSGIDGMMRTLIKEQSGHKVHSVMVSNLNPKSPKPDLSPEALVKQPFYKAELPYTMYRDGRWGLMVRHAFRRGDYVPMSTARRGTEQRDTPCSDVFARIEADNTVRWVESNSTVLACGTGAKEGPVCSVYYAGLHRKDALTAKGYVDTDMAWRHNIPRLGMEFAGRDPSGKKVAGLCNGMALASSVSCQDTICIDVPANWSLADAATIPYPYLTVYYAFLAKWPIKKQTILVLDGSSTVGLAAISTALHAGAAVITSTDSQAKADFIKKYIPSLDPQRIITESGGAMVQKIYSLTKGQGVDVIFNPLATNKPVEVALFDTLSTYGHFIEVGRPTDDTFHETYGSHLIRRNVVYANVDVKHVFLDQNARAEVTSLLQRNLLSGVIKPLPAQVYNHDKLSEAFAQLDQSDSFGTVLVKLRDEEKGKVQNSVSICAKPRLTFDPRKSYIITGGLGGIGLELTHWMAMRGAKKFVLTSRSGISNGFQEHKIRLLQQYYNITIKVSTTVIHELKDAKDLVKQAQSLGPVGGVFILVLAANDMVFAGIDKENFYISAGPKINDSVYLDKATREMCGKELDWFVPFSSVTASYGMRSQTAYGFGNSVMERVCEKRRFDGFPGLAIEYGAIDDVGIVQKTEDISVLNTEVQFKLIEFTRINESLDALDVALRMTDCVVVSMRKRLEGPNSRKAALGGPGLLVTVGNIFGTDLNAHDNSLNLGSMGLDSMSALELKGILEKDFDYRMDIPEIRKLTIGDIKTMDAETSNRE